MDLRRRARARHRLACAARGRSRPSSSRRPRRPPGLAPCTSTAPATPTAEPPSPRALAALAGPQASQISANGRLQFFDLRPAAARLAHRTTPAERASLSDAVLYPVVLGFGRGFSYQENANGVPFRWAAKDAELTFDDPLRGERMVRFTAQLFGGAATPSSVTMTLPDGTPQASDRHRSGQERQLPGRPRARRLDAAAADQRARRAQPARQHPRSAAAGHRAGDHVRAAEREPGRRLRRRRDALSDPRDVVAGVIPTQSGRRSESIGGRVGDVQ